MKTTLLTSLLFYGVFSTFNVSAADPDFLWKTINEKCVPDYNTSGQYAPCTLVDEKEGTVIYKADGGNFKFLLLPIKKITGIEDPSLLSDSTKPYFYQAWLSRALLSFELAELKGAVSEKSISLALNAINSRSQNQLHIHISCLSPTASAIIRHVDMSQFGSEWTDFPKPFHGHNYSARKLTLDELRTANVFKIVDERVKQKGFEMKYTTIGLVNLDKDTFLLLTSSGNEGLKVGAEGDLQDQSCSSLATR